MDSLGAYHATASCFTFGSCLQQAAMFAISHYVKIVKSNKYHHFTSVIPSRCCAISRQAVVTAEGIYMDDSCAI